MFRKRTFFVSWAIFVGLGLLITVNLHGQDRPSEKRDSCEDLELLTKKSIRFLTKRVKNAKIAFQFKTPDREGGHEFAAGGKVPPVMVPSQTFKVEGEFLVTGQWKENSPLKGHLIQVEIPIQAIPVFNIQDEKTLKRIRESQKFDWKSWGVDETEDPTENKSKQKSKPAPKPDGEHKIVLDFELSSKNGKIEQKGKFAFWWEPSNDQWAPGTYYKITAAPNDGLCVTTRAGVFSASIKRAPSKKQLKRMTYHGLRLLGYDVDPFYWLK